MAVSIYNIDNTNIAQGAGIKATKLEGEYDFHHSQTGTIANATEYFGPIRGSNATLHSLEAAITEAIATGADRTVTIDLQRSTGGGAFSTVLSAPITFNNGSTLRVLTSALLSSTSAIDGDLYKLIVTVAGSAGAQAQGLVVRVILREDAA